MQTVRSRRAGAARGFSLVELMVVVIIVVVLAFVAVGAYHKHMDNARKAEVYSLFGEIRVKEEAYHAEFSRYASTAPDENTWWPTAPNGNPQAWQPAPATWTQVGINPGTLQIYCSYNVVAGLRNQANNIGARGLAWFQNKAPQTDWWYANGQCDNDHNPAVNALFLTSSDNTAVYEQNPHN